MRITLAALEDFGACSPQRRLFKRLFGEGGTVTLPKLLRAADKGLNIQWAVHQFMSDAQEAEYRRVWDIADDLHTQALAANDWDWSKLSAPYRKAQAYCFMIALLRYPS